MELKIDVLELGEQATIQLVDLVSKKIDPLVQAKMQKYSYKEYLTLGECAEYLNVSRSNLSIFIQEGLKVTKINQTKRIKKTDADSFMIENQI